MSEYTQFYIEFKSLTFPERETPVLALDIKVTLCSKFTLKIVFAPFYLFVTFISCKLVKSSTFLPPFSL